MAALAEVAGAGGEGGFDGGVGGDPVCEGVFAVLDDAVGRVMLVDALWLRIGQGGENLRFASLIAIVGLTGLARSNGGIVDQLEKMLAVSGDNGQLFAVLTQSIELIGESRLKLFTGDVGKLGFCDKRLGFSTDEFLLENDNARGVRLLIFELGNLVGDFLLAVSAGLDGSFDVADALDGDTVLVVAVDELVFELPDFVN